MLGVVDGAEAEQHVLEVRPPAWEVMEQLGDEHERHAGIDRALDGANAGRDDEHQPEQRVEVGEAVAADGPLQRAQQSATQTGDGGRQGEGHDLCPSRVDADGLRRHLTAPNGGQPLSGRSSSHEDDNERADGEDGQRQEEEGSVGGEVDGPQLRSGYRDACLAVARPALREHQVVDHEGEGEGRQRQIQAAEAQGREGDHHADNSGDGGTDEDGHQHGHAVVGRQLGRGQGAEAGEARLTQRDLSGHPHDDRVRQEDDAHDDRLRHQEQPERREEEEGDGQEDDDERREHHPVQPFEARVAQAGGERRRWRTHARQWVGHLGLAQAWAEKQERHQQDERHRRTEALYQLVAERQVLGEHLLADPEQEAAQQRERQTAQTAEHGGGDGGHHQHREVDGVDPGVEGREEHAGQGGQDARQHPRRRRHPLGVDALQLQQARALDDGAHAQSERRRTKQDSKADDDDDGGDDHGDLVGVDAVGVPLVEVLGVGADSTPRLTYKRGRRAQRPERQRDRNHCTSLHHLHGSNLQYCNQMYPDSSIRVPKKSPTQRVGEEGLEPPTSCV